MEILKILDWTNSCFLFPLQRKAGENKHFPAHSTFHLSINRTLHSATVVQKAKKKTKGEYSFLSQYSFFISQRQSLLTGFVRIPQVQSFISIYLFFSNAKMLIWLTNPPSFIHIGQE